MYDGETPDFLGCDAAGSVVGIEMTQLRQSPDERHWRRIAPVGLLDDDSSLLLRDLMYKKGLTLAKGQWPACDRKILVVMSMDVPIDEVAAGLETDLPSPGGFGGINRAGTAVDVAQLLSRVNHPAGAQFRLTVT